MATNVARNFHHLAAEFRTAMRWTGGDIGRSLEHVFDIDRQFRYRATLLADADSRRRVRSAVRASKSETAKAIKNGIGIGPKIVREVIAAHGITVDQFLGHGVRGFRNGFSRARAEAIWRLRTSPQQLSFPQCAALCGMRNHTSAIYAFRKFEASMVEQKAAA